MPGDLLWESGMTRCLALFALLVVLGATGGAYGQGSPGGVGPAYAPVVLRVACGGAFGAACTKVLPRIAAQTVRTGLDLKPAIGGLPSDVLTAVCDGQVAAAIVQRDPLALFGRQPFCLGHFDLVGQPLYPIYAFLVARADTPFRSLDELARDRRRRVIMAGAEGTGGQITLGFLLRSGQVPRQSVTVAVGDPDVGLRGVADGSIDSFFAVEPLGSPLLDRVRRAADAHGKPLYTFLDINPAPELFRISDGAGHCLYRLTGLDFGGAAPVTTVSLDAVLILGRTFRGTHARGGPGAADALTDAIDASREAILADTASPGDWRPTGSSCQ